MFSWNSLAFPMIQWMLAIWSLIPLPFVKPALNIWNFTVRVLLKPGLENLEHYFASLWDEYNCTVVQIFFGIAFLWDWNENWPCQSCGHCWVFQICWHIECSTFTASSFSIWNSSTGIPPPPLALFIVMFPKVHLTSFQNVWLWSTPSWLSGSLRSLLYSILATSSWYLN